MPVLTIFAGPNGSGKSSLIRRVDFAGRDRLLEADAIASRMDEVNPRRAAIAAGREVIQRARQYLDGGLDFAIETTLSGSWTTAVIKQAQAKNFRVSLIFVCVDTPERNVQRVSERVAQGGHDVPEDDVRRRYHRSLQNLNKLIHLLDEVIIYDNSGAHPTLVLEVRSGRIVKQAPAIPLWARQIIF